MRRAALVVAVVLCFGLAGVAQAGPGLAGETLLYQYLFPDTGSVFESFNVTEAPGAEFSMLGLLTTDLSAFNILIDMSPADGLIFSAGSFNGPSFFDVFASIDPFTSVTINPATTLAGFDASRVFFDADTIQLNFTGLPINPGADIVSIDINTSAVPEPSTLALCLIGGLGVMAYRWRCRQPRA